MLIRKTTARRYTGPSVPRSDKRYSNPLLLLNLDGRCVYTVDWSLGGVKIAGVYEGLPLGREVEGRVIGHDDDAEEDAIHFVAKVIRCDLQGKATHLRFTMMSDAAFDAMESALVRREATLA